VPNPEQYAERYTEEHAASAEELALAEGEVPHDSSLTAVAAEALRSGLYPEAEADEVPGEDELLRAGDPDVDPLENLYSGEEMPGGSMPTPDQNDVEDAGRAAGITEVDNGALRTAEELVERRDSHRWRNESLSAKA
jgi:hypothetical protein